MVVQNLSHLKAVTSASASGDDCIFRRVLMADGAKLFEFERGAEAAAGGVDVPFGLILQKELEILTVRGDPTPSRLQARRKTGERCILGAIAHWLITGLTATYGQGHRR